jgi:hypothetical protein
MLAQVSAGTFHKPKPTRGISLPDARVIVLLPIFMFGCWKKMDAMDFLFGVLSGFFMQEFAMIYHRQIAGISSASSKRTVSIGDEPLRRRQKRSP